MKTEEQFQVEYTRRLRTRRYQALKLRPTAAPGLIYDATWAMALGLHAALERVRMNDSSGCGHLPGELVPLEEFDYQNEKMGCVLRKSLHDVSFTGVTVSHKKIKQRALIPGDSHAKIIFFL